MKSRTRASSAPSSPGRRPPPTVTPFNAGHSGAEISADIAGDLLRTIGQQFYLDRDKLFFQERKKLLQAITLPAKWLSTRGFEKEIPAARYRQIVMDVIQDVKRFGSMPTRRTPALYFLSVMQKHLQHHGEEYYEEAKASRNLYDEVILGLEKRRSSPATDSTLADLAALHKLARSPGGPKKKPAAAIPQTPCTPPATPQLDLFQ
jgi:hypothetical protein